ncbi:MAG: hypothetical protein ABW162_07650 [Candidatus Sedimenticola sp. PURPLELP]
MRIINLVILLSVSVCSFAQNTPAVIGYGVKSCETYTQVYDGWDKGEEAHIAEYLRYRDWLSGMITGLSLATDMDVLKGSDIKGAMRRIELICDERPDDDFFTASMDLIRTLSSLQ